MQSGNQGGLHSSVIPTKTAASPLAGQQERGRSSGVEHNLAKVGVEGSNPSARSSFLQGNEAIQMVVRGRFLLPRPPRESWGSSRKRKAAGYRLSPAWGSSRSHGFPPARQAAMGCVALHHEGWVWTPSHFPGHPSEAHFASLAPTATRMRNSSFGPPACEAHRQHKPQRVG